MHSPCQVAELPGRKQQWAPKGTSLLPNPGFMKWPGSLSPPQIPLVGLALGGAGAALSGPCKWGDPDTTLLLLLLLSLGPHILTSEPLPSYATHPLGFLNTSQIFPASSRKPSFSFSQHYTFPFKCSLQCRNLPPLHMIHVSLITVHTRAQRMAYTRN